MPWKTSCLAVLLTFVTLPAVAQLIPHPGGNKLPFHYWAFDPPEALTWPEGRPAYYSAPKQLAGCSSAPGRADLFYAEGLQVMHIVVEGTRIMQTTALGNWSNYPPACTSGAPGELDVAIVNQSGQIALRSFRAGAWGAWRTVPGGPRLTGSVALGWESPGVLDLFARSEAGGLVSTSWHGPYCVGSTCYAAGFGAFVEHNIPVRNSPTAVAQASWGRVMVLISDSFWQQSWVNYFSRGAFNYDWSYFGNEWVTTPAPWSRGSDDHAIGRKADGSLWDIWVGANSSAELWQTATASPTLVQSGSDAIFYTAKDASTSYQRIYRSEYRFH